MIKHYINFNHLTRLAATLTLLLSFGLMSQAQGQTAPVNETFSNVGDYGGYQLETWNGDQGGTWTATDARTDRTINGKAIMVRNGELTSPSVSGGIGSLTVTTQRQFGGGSGDMTVTVNGTEVGTVPYSENVQTTTIPDINVAGDIIVVIDATNSSSDRVVIDDLQWTGYSASVPTLSVLPLSLSDFTYTVGDGPSSAQSFTLSGANLDGSDVSLSAPANFAISENEVSGYGSSVTLSAFDGTETTLYVLMEAGLTEGDYSGSIDISGGGTSATVDLSGSVFGSFSLPFTNAFRNQDDYDAAVAAGFTITSNDQRTSGDGYLKIDNGQFVQSPSLDLSSNSEDALVASYDMQTFGGGSDPEFSFLISEDGGNTFTTVASDLVPGSYETIEHSVDLSTLGSLDDLVAKFEQTDGSKSTRFRDFELKVEAPAVDPVLSVSPETLTGLDYALGEGPSDPQSLTLSGENLDGSDVSITAPADFEVSETEASGYGSSVTLSAFDGTETTLYVRLSDGLTAGTYNGDLTVAGGGATDATVGLSGEVIAPVLATLPYSEDFDPDLSEVLVVDVSGFNTWEQGSTDGRTYAEANGFNTGETEETWLILPGFDLTATSDELMQFDTSYRFGNDDADNFLKLVYSTDYSGAGDPSGSTWTELPFTKPDASETVTPSGNIDLSGVSGSEVYLAFQYRYEPGNYRRWRVSDVEIFEASNPLFTVSPSELDEFSYTEGEGPSASQTVDVSGQNLDPADATITMTAPADFEVSLDDVSYSSSVTADAAAGELASTTVYVRLSDGLTAGTYNGDLTVSGGGATEATVSLSGEVSPPPAPVAGLDGLFKEDFSAFTGSGFSAAPVAGQLNSGNWRITGMSDGDGTFGGEHDSGDFSRGTSTGGVTTGGTYAFDADGTTVLGVQPGGSDFTPGEITLKLENTSGATINELYVSYDIYVFNDQGRSSSFNFAYSTVDTDDTDYTAVEALDYETPEAADGSPAWEIVKRSTTISGLSLASGDFIYLQWNSNDVSGGGSRDEFGLSNLTVSEISAEISDEGGKGYRMLALPVDNLPFSELAGQNLIQGISGTNAYYGEVLDAEGSPIDFEGPEVDANVYQFDNTTNWTAPSDISNEIAAGTGFIWFFFNNDRNVSVPLPFNLYATDELTSGNVVRPQNADNNYTLLGNPYNTALPQANVTGNIQAGVQVWNPIGGDGEGAFEAPVGDVAPFTGFFVEKSGAGGDVTMQDPGSSPRPAAEDELSRIALNLRGVSEDGQTVADNATQMRFMEGAGNGWDTYDLTKLRSLNHSFAAVSFVGDKNDQPNLQLIDSRAQHPEEMIEVPVAFTAEQFSGEFELSASLENIPADWDIYLIDTETGESVDARDGQLSFSYASESDVKGSETLLPQGAGRALTQSYAKNDEAIEARFILQVNPQPLSAPVGGELPQELALGQNYPNPFNPATQISYDLPESADVRLEVYNVQGQRVATLVNASQTAGSYNVSFDAGNLASGVYLYRLQTGNSVLTRKMTLVK